MVVCARRGASHQARHRAGVVYGLAPRVTSVRVLPRRVGRASRFKHHARFSFGPNESVIDTAVARLAALLERSRA